MRVLLMRLTRFVPPFELRLPPVELPGMALAAAAILEMKMNDSVGVAILAQAGDDGRSPIVLAKGSLDCRARTEHACGLRYASTCDLVEFFQPRQPTGED